MKRGLAIATIVLVACDADSTNTSITSARDSSRRASSSGRAGVTGPKPEFVRLAEGVTSGRDFVRGELSRAASDGRQLVIYVGATWCEPCQYFHDAVERGELDRELAGVRFVELDFDAHAALASEADMKCTSKMIPLFSRPDPDGTCSARRVEGAIKGPGAVGFILPKLQAILAD